MLSVRLTYINVVEVDNVVGYAIVTSRQTKSLSRGLCPYHPNRVAHYRYTLKMRLPDTCTLSPLRRVARATPLMVGAVIASMAASSRQVRWAHFFYYRASPSFALHYALVLPDGKERGQNFAAPYRPWLACPPCPLRVHGPLRHPGARPAPPTSSRPPLGGFGRAVAPVGRAFLSATASQCRLPELGRVSSLRPKAATRQSVLAQ